MKRSFALALLLISAWLGEARTARAVLVGSTNGNTDPVSLQTAGGPGNTSLPGWVNVGRSSLNGTITYLGNRWAITAAHVEISNDALNDPLHPTPVSFGPFSSFVDPSSVHVLHNPNSSEADLKIFRLQDDPGLPSLIPYINSALPSGRVIMIGRGLSAGPQLYWNSSTDPWTEFSSPNGSTDKSGFFADPSGSRVMRWGEKTVHDTGVSFLNYLEAFTTRFDEPSKAQATNGDSGGPGFTLVGTQWYLSGIMVNVLNYNGQPASTAVFGDLTAFADLSVYRDEILLYVPEPSAYLLALMAAAGLALFRRRARPALVGHLAKPSQH